jgi:hypothetical protein
VALKKSDLYSSPWKGAAIATQLNQFLELGGEQ